MRRNRRALSVLQQAMGSRPIRAIALAAVALALPGLAAASWAATKGSATAPPAPASLTTRQLAGQHLIYAYSGLRPPAALERRIGLGEAAGVILFNRNIASRAQLRAQVARLQAIPRPAGLRAPLLIMIDQEGGLVKRLAGAPRRSPAQLGRIGSAGVARSEGAATAANLRGAGVNVDLAPVLDVARPGSFQERLGRSYGRDPALVARLGTAFAGGLRAGRVAATAKHFPGIGVPRVDEDTVASRIGLSRESLRGIDEAPFVAAVHGGIDLVMLSTAVYPAFDSLPALYSRRVGTDELRGRLGFGGVAITDDLETASAAGYGTPQRRASTATRAGADLLLFAQSYANGARALEALVQDARAGRVSGAELRRSTGRVLALRQSLAG
jgi:beta-N-acetylhexosaminidase